MLSFRGDVQTAREGVRQTPLMLSVGGSHHPRVWQLRFRDENSLLLQAEGASWSTAISTWPSSTTRWRHDVDLDLNGLKDDFGVGVRVHGPFSTPLRVEFAKSREAFNFVFTSSAAF